MHRLHPGTLAVNIQKVYPYVLHLNRDTDRVVSGLEKFWLILDRKSIQLPLKKGTLVSLCEAIHCIRARALQTRVDAFEEIVGGDSRG